MRIVDDDGGDATQILHWGVKLTKLNKKQSDYINIPVEGPYKANHYRY